MLPALISAGASLLGGLFGQSSAAADRRFNAQQIDKQNAYNNPINIRKRAEKAGFNPLLFVGPGVGLQTGVAQANSANYMGAAIADAGMAIADNIANSTKRKQAEQLGALEIENAKLQNKLLQLTLRPKVGGVYAQRETTPTIAAAVGGGNANTDPVLSGQRSGGAVVDSDHSGLTPLSETLPIDPRRKVDNSAITTTSGFMVVDNPAFGRIYSPTLDGDEPLQWYDYPTLAINAGASRLFEGARERYLANEAQPKRPSTDKLPVAPPRYTGRGTYGMPRRSQNAMGWGY